MESCLGFASETKMYDSSRAHTKIKLGYEFLFIYLLKKKHYLVIKFVIVQQNAEKKIITGNQQSNFALKIWIIQIELPL